MESPRLFRVPSFAWRVAVAGAAALIVELTILRYVPGEIRVLGYFTNFVLLAAYLGLGIGMLAARRWPARTVIGFLAPIALLAVVGLSALAARLHIGSSPGEVLFLEYQTKETTVPLFPFLAVAYTLLALGFAPLGYWVGTTLAGDQPLARYAWNIGGSLAGIAVFTVLSALGLPPAVWVACAGVFSLGALASASRAWKAVGLVAVLAATGWSYVGTRGTTWSPYQKITTADALVHPKLGLVQEWSVPMLSPEDRAALVVLPRTKAFTVRVNDDSYQTPIDLSDAALKEYPAVRPYRLQYDLAFLAFKGRAAGNVLVLGAGTGNDVAAALRAGATHIDAVEIDPEILRLGRLHPEHPYDDARVTAHLADARTFLARTSAYYDTIVYGLLDSHVLLSSMSNVRLDSYVFTTESFAAARAHLTPGGVLIVSHAVGQPWFVDRMRATLARAFERPPVVVSEHVRNPQGFVYAAGDRVPDGRPIEPGITVLEDDWPFVYLRKRSIPREYLIAMGLMAIASLALVRGAAGRGGGGPGALHFFALGGGFMLLETRGLTVMALVLGSTWGVTSAVFAAVLVMALGATMLGARIVKPDVEKTRRATHFVYALLAVALLTEVVVDIADVAAMPPLFRVVIGSLLVALPLLASGAVFSTSLVWVGSADRALAANLVGAMAGGLLEYLSMVLGFRALVLIAAVFYAVAFASGRPMWKTAAATPPA